MAVWSCLRSPAVVANVKQLLKAQASLKVTQNVVARQMGGHGPKLMDVQPSRFQWHKFKDMLHFYVMLGVIPITGLLFYLNVFVGPATLTEIPENYEPKHWEYHRHPLTRFIARYMYPSPQQEYEKFCHHIYEENEKAQIRKLESEIHAKMAERRDYQSYYYRPVIAKYHRVSKEAADYLESIRGD